MTNDFSNTDNIIDVRDIIARFEELEREFETAMEEVPDGERGNMDNKHWKEWAESEEAEEFKTLQTLLDELKGIGGDEKWRGDWYSLNLIKDDYFEEYTEELIIDLGYISRDFPSWIAIDWGKTAEEVQQDYMAVEYDGVTYWTR